MSEEQRRQWVLSLQGVRSNTSVQDIQTRATEASGGFGLRQLTQTLFTLLGVRSSGIPQLPTERDRAVALAGNFQSQVIPIGDFYEKILLQTQRSELEQRNFQMQVSNWDKLHAQNERTERTLQNIENRLRPPL